MIPDARTGVWILYIWIFILLWKAAGIQGEHHANKITKQTRALDRVKREDLLEEHLSRRILEKETTNGHVSDSMIYPEQQTGKEQPDLPEAIQDNTGRTNSENKKKGKRGDSKNNVEPLPQDAEPENVDVPITVPEGPLAPVETQDTPFHEPHVPPPLDTQPVFAEPVPASVKDSKDAEPILESTVQPTKVHGETVSANQDSDSVAVEETNVNPAEKPKQRSKNRDDKVKTVPQDIQSNVEDTSDKSSDVTDLQNNIIDSQIPQQLIDYIDGVVVEKDPKDTDQTLKFRPRGKSDKPAAKKTGKKISQEEQTKVSSSDETTEPDMGFTPHVEEVEHGKAPETINEVNKVADTDTPNTPQVVSEPLKVVTYNTFLQNMLSKAPQQDPAQSSSALAELENIKQNQHNLLFLKNATKHAEELQKTFRLQKLQLKSYMEVLRNLTEQHTKDKKILANYTKSVKSKVHNIVKPVMQENIEIPDKPQVHPAKPHNFLAKNITETLRARVDMVNLHKSEAFWDKKGLDIDEPHFLKDSDNTIMGDQEDIPELNQLNLGVYPEDYENQDPVDPEALLDGMSYSEAQGQDLPPGEPIKESETPVKDAEQAKLDDIRKTRDRLAGRTHHENLVFSQIVSGRIHGNVLAPPPERCSVKANMARFRPPESDKNEDDSLFYRVDYKPEMDKALEGGPMDYLPDYKNPCWLSKITDDSGSLWYDYTESGLTYKRMSFLYEVRLSKNSNWRMRCLPLLYFVGVTKCGTTDMYSRLLAHPEIMRPAHKEPMWWNRLTLGMAQSLRKPFRYYLDFFDEAAELMRRKVTIKDGKPYHPGITLDATPANLWDYDCWTDIPGNRGLAEPKYTLAHSIKKLNPKAKILMILREPTDRLYSQYRMKSHKEPSLTFHKQVVETIVNFNECLKTRTLRSCAYDHDLAKHEFGNPGGVFLRASLYYVFVKDWLDVFPREQVMIIRTEDYHNDTMGTLGEVFDFLGLSPLSKEKMQGISKRRDINTRADHTDRSMEPILPETQKLLDDFFRPYNKMLAKLLHNKKFKWDDVRNLPKA